MMSEILHILLLEDRPTDAELNERMLRQAGIDFTSLWVGTRAAFVAALDTFRPDLILADYKLLGFDGLQALAIVRERSPDLPYIFVTGAMGEERAAEAIKQGASDYILKDRLMRLPAAVQHALEERETKRQLRQSEERNHLIVSHMPQGCITWNVQFHVESWNPGAERIFGFTDAEVMGKHPYDLLVPKEAQPAVDAIWKRLLEGDETANSVNENITKDGKTIICEWTNTPLKRPDGTIIGVLSMVQDITERKQAEVALRNGEIRLQAIIENLTEGLAVSDLDGQLLYFNRAALELHRFTTLDECRLHLTKFADIFELSAMDGTVLPVDQWPLARILRGESLRGLEVYVRHIQAGWKRVFNYCGTLVRDTGGHPLMAILTIGDITGRKQAEEALRESEERFRKITESAQDAIIMMGPDRRISFWNAAAERIFGYTSTEAMGQEMHPLITPAPAYAKFTQAYPHFQATGEGPIIGKVIEVTALRKGGEEFPIEVSIAALQLGGQWHAIGIFHDIAERKQAEEMLRDSHESLNRLLNSIVEGAYGVDTHGNCTFVNQSCLQMLGYQNNDELLGKHMHTLMHHSHSDGSPYPVSECGIYRAYQAIQTINVSDEVFWRKDGSSFPVEYWSNPIVVDGVAVGAILTFIDITERKRAETAIQHANRALATLSAVNRNLVHATNEDELLRAICQAIVEQRGYQLAWVGYVQHDESKSIKIMARAGHDEGYLDAMQPTWAEEEPGMRASGRAIRSGATQLCQDIANDPHYSPWIDEALKRGYAASIALPLLNRDNTVFGTLTVYAAEVNAFSPSEIDLLEEMAGDLAFGVLTLHTRHERDLALEQNQRQLVQLQNSLEDTVRAIASIVEMRDPYTAGHQARVADLAAAIARQMGLPDEQAHAIHLAGTVHDLGKIQIPAEILSKPGKITDIEHSLIKIHPKAGYDILQGIDFPWPIAQMVLQHHERLDGSGYPQGLKGDAILLEARILSVADVVEAMSSHRPYRPGLGIEVALAEITKQRGSHFDPQVVDACLALFLEQRYYFKS